MLKSKDIVRSHKHQSTVIPYQIVSIDGGMASCQNLIDTYIYRIPLEELYLWIVPDTSKESNPESTLRGKKVVIKSSDFTNGWTGTIEGEPELFNGDEIVWVDFEHYDLSPLPFKLTQVDYLK